MLAEGEETYLRNDSGFIATYAWRFHHMMNDIAKGKENVNKLDELLADERANYKLGYHIYFTSNHDENSWAGTVFERLGDAHNAFAALCATLDGMPLIYGGQEEPFKKRLAFFEKDTIPFSEYKYESFYTHPQCTKEKEQCIVEWQHMEDYPYESIRQKTFTPFKREKNGDSFIGVFNFSNQPQSTTLTEPVQEMNNVFSNEITSVDAGANIELAPWEYLLFSSK